MRCPLAYHLLTLERRQSGSMGRGNEVEISMILFHAISTSSSSWERKKKMWSLLSLPAVAWMFVSPKMCMLNPSTYCDGVWMWGLWEGISSCRQSPQREVSDIVGDSFPSCLDTVKRQPYRKWALTGHGICLHLPAP